MAIYVNGKESTRKQASSLELADRALQKSRVPMIVQVQYMWSGMPSAAVDGLYNRRVLP